MTIIIILGCALVATFFSLLGACAKIERLQATIREMEDTQ